jgi:NarL family two-component system response regulator YdfI
MENLTPREIEVAESVWSGGTLVEVAKRLGISIKTVNAHLNSIYKKLSCGNKASLVLAVERWKAARK